MFTQKTNCAKIPLVIIMDLLKWGKLLIKIERKRRRLYELSQLKPHDTDELLQVSRQLDELINRYQLEIKKTKVVCS